MQQTLIVFMFGVVFATGVLGQNRGSVDSERLTVFDCGNLRITDVASIGLTNEDTPVRELFVPCYLTEYPAGLMIWDAGLPIGLV